MTGTLTLIDCYSIKLSQLFHTGNKLHQFYINIMCIHFTLIYIERESTKNIKIKKNEEMFNEKGFHWYYVALVLFLGRFDVKAVRICCTIFLWNRNQTRTRIARW